MCERIGKTEGIGSLHTHRHTRTEGTHTVPTTLQTFQENKLFGTPLRGEETQKVVGRRSEEAGGRGGVGREEVDNATGDGLVHERG